MKEYLILASESEKDYELIDSGDGEKLERFGKIILIRPDPQAIWPKNNIDNWKTASAIFKGDSKGKWVIKNNIPDKWIINFDNLSFNIKLSTFKHVGIFPEHKVSWKWMDNIIVNEKRKLRVLNLFAYTGGATLAALRANAEVVHLDASRVAVGLAKENALISKLEDRQVKWIIDDAMSFVQRELRRGNKYDGIIMDPPSYGHGPEGEIWKIEDDLLKMLMICKEIMSSNLSFILLNGYAAGYSALGYANLLKEVMPFAKNKIEQGEIGIKESARGLILPAGIFARWSNY